MIITSNKSRIVDGLVEISVTVEWSKTHFDQQPTTLRYRIPERYGAYASETIDAFLVALLPAAMFFGEDIAVHGAISEKLLYGIKEYQRILHFYKPEWFSLVSVTATERSVVRPKHRGIMCSYSGGVDSMYTFVKHLPMQEPLVHAQVNHALFVEQFGSQNDPEETIKAKENAYQDIMSQHDIALLTARTNALDFYHFNNDFALAMVRATALVSISHAVSNRISTFYFSADDTHDFPLVTTAQHTLVPLLSSENLDIVVHGASTTKMEKLELITTWPFSYNSLTVCWEHPNALRNCGRCVKCCHTMAGLDMLGVLERYTTFTTPVSRHHIRTRIQTPKYFYFSKTWARFARMYGRSDFVWDFTYVLWRNRFIWYVLKPLEFCLMLPRTLIYRLSAWLKQRSHQYARFVVWLKS